MKINFEIDPGKKDTDTIYEGLVEFNKPTFGNLAIEDYGCFIRDENNKILGGATGFIIDKIAVLKFIWIDENLRRQGYGEQILGILEAEFKQRNIHEIHLDTYSFQAPEFYKKLGFKQVAHFCFMKKTKIEKLFFIKEL